MPWTWKPAPVVAALNGHALAGGCIIATACDARVAVRGGGFIGVTELLVGVPFPTAAVEILRHATNLGRLDRSAFTLAKTQLRRGALELVERHRAPDDAVLADRWTAPDTMNAIREYLRRLKAPSPR